MRLIVLSVLYLLAMLPLHAQQKYWIYLNEKNPKLKNAPVEEKIAHLRQHGLSVVVYSQWLSAASVFTPESFSFDMITDSCYLRTEPVAGRLLSTSLPGKDPESYDAAVRQIGGEALLEAGYSGKGLKIGIIDAGFLNADRHRNLRDLIRNDRILGYRNFIETDENEIFTKDHHGTKVWVHLAGSRNDGEKVNGMAYNAAFYLARTDQDEKEYRGEEDYWIAALEWMYDEGVRIVNSSLGYSDGYDDPDQNYQPWQADGQSTAIARAATIAVREKGMILVVSAGNEGNRKFRVVSIPGDASGVLTVGATNQTWPWTRQGYSSVGPPGLPYVKPDVACFSLNGTSYSAPVITGLAAALWEARPDLTNMEVADWIRSSAHLHAFPNNYLGHGVPNGFRLLRMIQDHPDPVIGSRIIRTAESSVEMPASPVPVVVYHKFSHTEVAAELVLRKTENTYSIFRPEGISRTTVVTPGEVVEIIWNN